MLQLVVFLHKTEFAFDLVLLLPNSHREKCLYFKFLQIFIFPIKSVAEYPPIPTTLFIADQMNRIFLLFL